MEIEVIASCEQNGQKIQVAAKDQMDSRNEDKIQLMKNVIAEFIPWGHSAQVYIQESPKELTTSETYPSKPAPNKPSFGGQKKNWNPKLGNQAKKSNAITGPQIGFLRNLLKGHNIPEAEFCKDHNVDCIEHLSGKTAQTVIGQLVQLPPPQTQQTT